jgi:hypothetical protein
MAIRPILDYGGTILSFLLIKSRQENLPQIYENEDLIACEESFKKLSGQLFLYWDGTLKKPEGLEYEEIFAEVVGVCAVMGMAMDELVEGIDSPKLK